MALEFANKRGLEVLEEDEARCGICRDVCLDGDLSEMEDGKMVCEYCQESYQ
jgi:hypothetical protein